MASFKFSKFKSSIGVSILAAISLCVVLFQKQPSDKRVSTRRLAAKKQKHRVLATTSSYHYDDSEIWGLINTFDNYKSTALYGEVEGEPTLTKMHYMVMPIWWSDENSSDPSTALNMEDIHKTFKRTHDYYSDMSWNKTNLSSTILPQTVFAISRQNPGWSNTMNEMKAMLDEMGYEEDKDYHGKMLIYHVAKSWPLSMWGGWGSVNGRNVWMSVPSYGITRHEAGHNYGHGHHLGETYTARKGSTKYDGWDMMSGGNGYTVSDFNVASKWFYNWVPDSSIIKMQPMGATTACPTCHRSGYFKIYTFDDKYMPPTPEKKMGIFIPFAVDGKRLYSYWLSYRGAGNKGLAAHGLSIHATWFSLGGVFGASYGSLKYDAYGDTSDQKDSFVELGTCYHVYPTSYMKDRAIRGVEKVQPVVCVDEIDVGKSISVRVEFLEEDAEESNDAQEISLECTSDGSSTSSIELDASKYALVHVNDAGSDGEIEVNLCTTDMSSTAYIYDTYPHSLLTYNAPAAYGSYLSVSNNFFNCCSEGSTLTVSGAKVVVVKQNIKDHLELSEIEIFDDKDINIAPTAKCFSHSIGWSGNPNCLNDGKIKKEDSSSCQSHSRHSSKNNYDYCVFDSPVEISRVKVHNINVWYKMSRTRDIQLSIYADVTGESGSAKFVGKMFTSRLEGWSSSSRDPHVRDVTLEKNLQCPGNEIAPTSTKYKSVYGEAFVTIPPTALPGSKSTIQVSCSFDKCQANSYLNGTTCAACPANHIAKKGSTSASACEKCLPGFERAHSLVDKCILSKTYTRIDYSKGWRLWTMSPMSETWWKWDVKELRFYSSDDCSEDSLIENTGKYVSSGQPYTDSQGYSYWYGPQNAFGSSSRVWGGRRDNKKMFYIGMMFDEPVRLKCFKLTNGNSGGNTKEIRVQAYVEDEDTWKNAYIVKDIDTATDATSVNPIIHEEAAGEEFDINCNVVYDTFTIGESGEFDLHYNIDCDATTTAKMAEYNLGLRLVSSIFEETCGGESFSHSVIVLNGNLDVQGDTAKVMVKLLETTFEENLSEIMSNEASVNFCVQSKLLVSNELTSLVYTKVGATIDMADGGNFVKSIEAEALAEE